MVGRKLFIILKELGSLKLTTFILSLLFIVVFWGTIFSAQFGLQAAREEFFLSWFVWGMGVVPLPGVKLILTALFVNLALSLKKFKFEYRHIGLWFIHLGILLLLVGGAYTNYKSWEGKLSLVEGESSDSIFLNSESISNISLESKDSLTMKSFIYQLPFVVKLKSFEIISYPGGSTAKDYRSTLTIDGNDYIVSMNSPLYLRGVAFYQSSYLKVSDHFKSSLIVKHNPARSFPHIAFAMMVFGFFFHFAFKMNQRRKHVNS